jgi:pyruvate dehydrogenase E1 component
LQPAQPKDAEDGIIKGLYKLNDHSNPQVSLVGSGSILNESIKAQKILDSFGIGSDVWSATSFNMLRKDGMEKERFNELNPTSKQKMTYVEECLPSRDIPVIAATDYMRAYPEQIRGFVNGPYYTLGTDGYGRSDSRQKLREFFEVDANNIARIAIYSLFRKGDLDKKEIKAFYDKLKVDPSKPNPWEV